mgnify:CR=1 FL=1
MTIEADPGHPRLREALAALPERREPARDLWPDIAARLPARAAPASRPMPARMRRWPWLFAAAASLAVVLLVPERRISDVLHERAAQKADAHLNAVDQTMRLEDQQTVDAKRRKRLRAELIEQLMAHPKQLWDHG